MSEEPTSQNKQQSDKPLMPQQAHSNQKSLSTGDKDSLGLGIFLFQTGALVLLTVQNVAYILTVRYLRTQPGDKFFASSVVVCSETVKFFVSAMLVARGCEWSFVNFRRFFVENTCGDLRDWMKISVPAVIYVLQNNLVYVAIANLDAVTYQVTYQLKLLTTAVFAVIILRQKLTVWQWGSLICLFVGVALVQLSSGKHEAAVTVKQSPLLGFIVVLLCCIMSGFAGVYFEWTLKSSDKSLWWRNFQLSALGIIFGLTGAIVNDGSSMIKPNVGFFFGFNSLVVLVVGLQSFGGLAVAIIVKYLDNIVKNFATSVAIVVACVASIFLFKFSIGIELASGTALVVTSVFVYSKTGTNSKAKQVEFNVEQQEQKLPIRK